MIHGFTGGDAWGSNCYAVSNLTSSDYYDKKIKSIITYDATTGKIDLDVEEDGIIDFSAVAPVDKRFPVRQAGIGGFGWWTGHYHQVDSFKLESLDISANLDMTQANCRYVAPIYDKMWLQMKVKKAPSCGAVLRYHTWVNSTRPENNIASDYYSNRLNNIDTSNQLFNQRLELIDNSLSVVEDVLDPDLRALLTPKTYTKSLKFMKSKGIVKSLVKGKTPFSRKSPTGRLLDKFFKEELLAKTSSTAFCSVIFKDNPAVSKSCSHETEKAFACAAGLLTKFDSITAPISIWKRDKVDPIVQTKNILI